MNELYNDKYVHAQLEKFRNRENNHFGNHIRLVKDLLDRFSINPPARLLDIGCSIGTFALELSLNGYLTIGLDFDQNSLKYAESLAEELGCSPDWICADASNFVLKEKVDVVICFDLFEHLEDDAIKKMVMFK